MTAPVVGYAGLTHLGICSAIGAAAKGIDVIGYSEDANLVVQIGSGRLPVIEPGLQDALFMHRARLTFTAEARDLAVCDIVYVAVDVATNDQGESDLSAIEEMVARIRPHLHSKAILVILSQVPPGFTRQVGFDGPRRYYQVETLIFGQALERATTPERFIVGCQDPTIPLPPAYGTFLKAFGCPILPMRYESAELTKIAINCFLVASVSTANTLAELAESIEADWQEIVPALRLDARIGAAAYLTAGLGISGGNLERDLATVLRLGSQLGNSTSVILAYLDNSRHMKDWAFRTVKRTVLDKVDAPRLGILGLAYKQDTQSTRNSPALALVSRLPGVSLLVHDPVVPASVVPSAIGVESAEDAAEQVDALLLMTPWPAYRNLDPSILARRMRGRVIIDPYRLLDPRRVTAAGLVHHSIGRSSALDRET